jgi:RNA recognition motif-containing protein
MALPNRGTLETTRTRGGRGGGGGGGGGGNSGDEVAVYVGNLPWSCDWKMLKDSFTSVFPDVVYADVATQGGAPGARSYGWGTVRFSSKQSRDNAIQRFNGKNMGGRNIEVRVDRGKSNNNNFNN